MRICCKLAIDPLLRALSMQIASTAHSRASGNPGPLAGSLQYVALGPRFREDERMWLSARSG
jgi:hypothetical protein